jgi:PAS domain S-box-containing protein
MPERRGRTHLIGLTAAAELLQLPEPAIEALVRAGYLASSADGDVHSDTQGQPTFAIGDVKAFLARNAEDGAGGDLFAEATDAVDPQALLDALDGRSEEMAKRAFDVFTTVFPEALSWSLTEQARFIEQARKRFEAILAVTGQGEAVDEALVGDLQDVGASAAWSGSPLPQLLVVLRISRDLVVQTAIEVAEERGRHWGLALSLLLTRVLPAMDRLTDSIAQGYWAAVVGREEESRARYENVVEHASDGICEIDLDGFVQYANPSFAVLLGRPLDKLHGAHVSEVLVAVDGRDVLDVIVVGSESEGGVTGLTILRSDGVRRLVEVRTHVRREESMVVGYAAVVRDVTAPYELEAAKNEFLALITHDLRNPLTTILGLGVTLETYAEELPTDRLTRMGRSIRLQAERIARLADDLYDVSQLESSSLVLSPRAVDVATTVDVALASAGDTTGVQVTIPPGLVVLADARRLEQVVANLVENALVHGAPPVLVEARALPSGNEVEITVTDHGDGVNGVLVPTLFSRLHTFARPDRDRSRGTGLGLPLVRGLVEAMGGRVWYDPVPGGGARFGLTLTRPPR